ncbi:MAG TPA: hypothetical protein VMX94_06295 [Armatimonadota bacterium]|nr:hypothetical protein [Armatimonadota bacterium]
MADATDVTVEIKTSWDDEPEHQYQPMLGPGKSMDPRLSNIAAMVEESIAAGKSNPPQLEIAIQYKDAQGKVYTCASRQHYEVDTWWMVDEEHSN